MLLYSYSIDANLSQPFIDSVNIQCLDPALLGAGARLIALQADLANPGGFIGIADLRNSLIRFSTLNDISFVTGSINATSGYKNGLLSHARFLDPKSFFQLNSTFIVVADKGRMRWVNTAIGYVGTLDGHWIYFNGIKQIVADSINKNQAYILEDNRIASVDVEAAIKKRYETYSSGMEVIYNTPLIPVDLTLTWLAPSKNYIYISTFKHGVIAYERQNKSSYFINDYQSAQHGDFYSFSKVYALSERFLLLPFIRYEFNTMHSMPMTLLYDMEEPEKSFTVETTPQVYDDKKVEKLNLPPFAFESWANGYLITAGDYASDSNGSKSNCLTIISVGLKGRLCNTCMYPMINLFLGYR